jgi:hypothetical protein
MERNPMPLPIKLLLNAESFGFGPTSAIADMFPYLREAFSYIGYAGSRHTLDLQRHFPYDEIIDLTGKDLLAFTTVVEKYDLFFTALNFQKAERTASMGIPTIIYDPLTWYWPEIPPVVGMKEVLYLAQSFHGVKERLHREPEKFGQCIEVSPFTSYLPQDNNPNILMLNMGGLINPFWPTDYYRKYVHAVIQAVKAVADPDLELHIICSKEVAALMPQEHIRTYTREEIFALLPKVKLAIQTPGLANIYESAAIGYPSLFLPPANDSQGQQLDLLRLHNQVDAFIEWDKRIDYKKPQKEVLEQIGQQINHLSVDRLTVLMQESLEQLSRKKSLRLPTLLAQYGTEGAKQAAEIVISKAEEMVCLKKLSC